jgi:hypothetical protein
VFRQGPVIQFLIDGFRCRRILGRRGDEHTARHTAERAKRTKRAERRSEL